MVHWPDCSIWRIRSYLCYFLNIFILIILVLYSYSDICLTCVSLSLLLLLRQLNFTQGLIKVYLILTPLVKTTGCFCSEMKNAFTRIRIRWKSYRRGWHWHFAHTFVRVTGSAKPARGSIELLHHMRLHLTHIHSISLFFLSFYRSLRPGCLSLHLHHSCFPQNWANPLKHIRSKWVI